MCERMLTEVSDEFGVELLACLEEARFDEVVVTSCFDHSCVFSEERSVTGRIVVPFGGHLNK